LKTIVDVRFFGPLPLEFITYQAESSSSSARVREQVEETLLAPPP
jgi:hypothetical protein